jgi:hypothetical protein
MKDAKFVRRGLHMTSYDKNDQQGGALNFTSQQQQRALRYDSDSTTNSGQPPALRKPPKADRPPSRGTRQPSRYSSSEREDPRRFHTIERSSYGPYSGSSGDDRKPYRSRSMSRSPQYAEARQELHAKKPQREHHKSTGNMRSDLDKEREGRLRRAMSFKDTRGGTPGSEVSAESGTPSQKASFLVSMKSLYASLSKAALSKTLNKTTTVSEANKNWFDTSATDSKKHPPRRPPRKPRSQSSMSDHNRSMSSLNTGSLNRRHQPPTNDHQRSMSSLNTGSLNRRPQQPTNDHQRSMSSLNTGSLNRRPHPSARTTSLQADGGQRHWEVHSTSSSTLPRSTRTTPSRATPPTRPTPTPRGPTNRVNKTRLSISSNRSSMEPQQNHYMVNGHSQQHQNANRDAPRFERTRDNTNRFFGQGNLDANDDSEIVERSRPPPDMRRYLLDNVNSSRSKNMSPVAKQPSVIRAM